jgi:hypothetical protein
MSTLGELLRAMPLPVKAGPSAEDEAAVSVSANQNTQAGVSPRAGLRDEQIQALVQQLFFHPEGEPVRKAGFAPVEESAQAALMCFDVAKALDGEGRYNIGLIDASSDALPLQEQLQIPAPTHFNVIWPVSSRMSLVPRESWWKETGLESVTERDLERLRGFMTRFDFSVLYCAPVSWLTMRIARSCDGVVLILTANKTRRLAATQIKEQLAKARIPLLGTVLAERRLPVPEKLYRRL